MRLDQALNIEDLKQMAKQRTPRIAFDFIEGGLDDERGIARNEDAFSDYRVIPRYLVDVSKRSQSTTLFGRQYDNPFGIAPTGGNGFFRAGADLFLAEAARDANIPFIMSGASNQSLEKAAKVAPDHAWYQLYAGADMAICEDMIRRSDAAGLGALVLTVDVPTSSNRERNQRNGYKQPLKITPKIAWDGIRHPRWLLDYLREGKPTLENWAPYAPPGSDSDTVQAFYRKQLRSSQTWRELEAYRRVWPRKLVVKGIMHPDDARRCAEMGVDGIMVSNHGGRQLDRAPSPLEMLPAIDQAVGDKLTVMFDSGIRRGGDIVIALALGAKFVFTGRATLYGTVAAGLPGARHAIGILHRELDMVMAQIGCPTIDTIGPGLIMPVGPNR